MVLITKSPYENEFSTDISLFVLRKSNLWLDFLKFTLIECSRFDSKRAMCNVAIWLHFVVANHRFCERVSKIVM